MAMHPDDHSKPPHGEAKDPAQEPDGKVFPDLEADVVAGEPELESGGPATPAQRLPKPTQLAGQGAPRPTQIARAAGQPTMLASGETPPAPVPNMSLETPSANVPVLAEAVPPEPADSDVLTMEAVEEPELGAPKSASEEIPVLEAVPELLPVAESPSSVVEILPVVEEDAFGEAPALPLAEPASGGAKAPGSDVVPLGWLPEVDPEQASQYPPTISKSSDDLPGAEPPAQSASDVAMAQPLSDFVEAEPASEIAEAEPVSEIAEAEPVSGMESVDDAVFGEQPSAARAGSGGHRPDVTGADLPGAAVTGSEHVLEDDLLTAEPASAAKSRSGLPALEAGEAASGLVELEAVLGDEPLDRGSRTSARVESPIRFGDEPLSGAAASKAPTELDATEEVLADEPVKPAGGSSAVNWDDIEELASGASKKQRDETMAFEGAESGSDLLMATDVPAEDSSAVDLGGPASKGKAASGIDVVAEALESGVNLDDDGPLTPRHGPPSVEFDDILADEAEPAEEPKTARPGKTRRNGADDDEFATTALTDDELAATAKGGKKKKKKPEVEFDEEPAEALFAEEEDEIAPRKKRKSTAELEDEAAEALFAGDDDLAPPKKKTSGEIEEEAAAALFADDDDDAAVAVPADEDEEAVAVPVDDDEEAVAVPADDDDEAVATAVEDEVRFPLDDEDELPVKGKARPTTKAKSRVTVPLDDEDEEAPPARKARAKPIPAPAPRGPGCFGRLVGAAFFTSFGIVLVAGSVAGVWYFAPEILDEQHDLIFPNKVAKVVPKAQTSPVQHAFTALAAGEYDQAFEDVKDETEPAAVAVRGEARWLKHVKAAKQPLSKDDPEVKKAISELRTGKNDVLAGQIDQAFATQTKLEAANRALKDVQEVTQQAGIKADASSLPKALAETFAEKKQSDTLVRDVGTALAGAKIIENAEDVKAGDVQKALKSLADAQTTLAAVNKTLTDANVKDAGPRGVAQLAAAKQEYEDKLGEVNKVLADAKVKDAGAKGVQEIVASRAKLQTDRDSLETATKAAYEELVKAKVAPADGDPRKQLAEGVKRAREKAESPLALPLTQLGASLNGLGKGVGSMVEKGFDTAMLTADLGIFKAREQFIQTPAQKLDMFAELLQDRKRANVKELDAVLREAQWVQSKEANAPADTRGKAEYVSGLALRNQGKFDAARTAFAAALKLGGPKAAAWARDAKQALAELTDPRAYYMPHIEKLQAGGDARGAIAAADIALKALPGNGTLLAERGLLRLEASRGKGKLTPDVQAQIRTDAQAAAKADGGAAAGAFVEGLLEEELGQFSKAEELYRNALKLHKGNDEEATRYRIALARVLLRDRPAVAAPPAEEPAAPAKEKAAAPRPAYVHPITALVLSATLAVQPLEEPEPEQENPELAKRVRESVTLAKDLSASKNPAVRAQGYTLLAEAASKAGAKLTSATCLELSKDLLARDDPKVKGVGHLLRGQALVKQSNRTEGLKEYSRGLELLYPGLETREIFKMVEEHPAFQHPDTGNRPNPFLAEKHFGNGLHQYWSRDYPKAEIEFKQAIDYFGQDARYRYFLGLAQLAQATKLKRDQAYYSFEKGAQLEAESRPSVGEINASLERVQGELRQFLNSFRNKIETAGQ